MDFDQFACNPRINVAINAAGYCHPTPIQKQAIPVVLEERDVLGLAQTGTGKIAGSPRLTDFAAEDSGLVPPEENGVLTKKIIERNRPWLQNDLRI